MPVPGVETVVAEVAWTDAIAEGSVTVYGDPALTAALPGWFLPAETSAVAVVVAVA